jgi:hypothetical protein
LNKTDSLKDFLASKLSKKLKVHPKVSENSKIVQKKGTLFRNKDFYETVSFAAKAPSKKLKAVQPLCSS